MHAGARPYRCARSREGWVMQKLACWGSLSSDILDRCQRKRRWHWVWMYHTCTHTHTHTHTHTNLHGHTYTLRSVYHLVQTGVVGCKVLTVWPVTVLDSCSAILTVRTKSRHSLYSLTGEAADLSSCLQYYCSPVQCSSLPTACVTSESEARFFALMITHDHCIAFHISLPFPPTLVHLRVHVYNNVEKQ